jgi:Fe-S cluster assembly protein SufD
VSALLDSLQAGFNGLAGEQVEALGLGPTRRDALRRSLDDGLPTQRSEIWKYTALRALAARAFSMASPSIAVESSALAHIPGPRLVFVNGRLDAELSRLNELPKGVSLEALSRVTGSNSAHAAVAASSFESDAGAADQTFVRLNAALALDGALLEVAAGAAPTEAIHLVFVGAPASEDIASHLRHLIRVGAGARLALVEHHLGMGAQRHLCNHLLDLELAEGAKLLHARMQDEDGGASLIVRSQVRVGAKAEYRRLDLEMGASLSRHELVVSLEGEGASFVSGGAMLAGGRRHIDTRLRVRHIAPGCSCDLLWRGLASDRARVAFHGGIVIEVGADGSDARLSNKNLLLSEGAEIDTQPALEIYADEVKAAHGATVGRLDSTALFYLRSRGIPDREARALLTQAFCREALGVVQDAALTTLLSPRLEARLSTLEPAV